MKVGLFYSFNHNTHALGNSILNSVKTQDYFCLQVETNNSLQDKEQLEFWSFELGAKGIEEDEKFKYLKIYFPEAEAAQNFVDWLQGHFPRTSWKYLDLKKSGWEENWKKFLAPVQLADKIWIYPAGDAGKNKGEGNAIVLEPDLVFGSGHHPTTQLVARALMVMGGLEGLKIMDVGTGTGILCFTSLLEKASLALGFDIDLASRPNLVRNRLHNPALSKARFFIGGIEALKADGFFDVSIVNIIRRDSFPLLPMVYGATSKTGKLIYSGLLLEERSLVLERCEGLGFKFLQEQSREGWWCGLFEK